VDFKNTVIIMTSNIASQQIQKLTEEQGADWEIEAHVKDVLKQVFKPEFLNRIDEVIVFHMLTRDHLKKIVEIQLHYLADRLKDRKIKLEFTDKAKGRVNGTRLRSGLRGPAAEADDPAADREPAGAGALGRQVPRRRHGPRRRPRARLRLREGEQVT